MTFERLKEELDRHLEAVREVLYESAWPWSSDWMPQGRLGADGFVRVWLQAIGLTVDESVVEQLVDFYETQFGFEKMASPRIIPRNT